jgi:AraC family transcriptional regulator, regulatory protein of adaptative response / methylated-DNA-[protein]-cysteine methyltransferase
MMSETEIDNRWEAVRSRDRAADGTFVFAVKTTGVYCRPSCASRPPRRENVEFFDLPAAAEEAGYRACKRCQPRSVAIVDERLKLVQSVCDYVLAHLDDGDALTLDVLGAVFGFDPHHLQKTFKAVLQMSPRDYAEAQRFLRLKRELRAGGCVAEAVYGAGFGSSSRVYENADAHIGMTPAQYQKQGAGVAIAYTVASTTLGTLLVALTERGICAVGIYDSDTAAVTALHAEFPQAITNRDDNLAGWVEVILAYIEHGQPLPELRFDIQATAFQWRVWDELRRIPRGETRTYAQVAQAIGQPNAVRAVANACANNHAAVVIPCHRVIGSDGTLHGYKWGMERKRAILEREQGR